MHLDVLQTRYVVEADERWTAFLAEAWEPFLTAPGDDGLHAVLSSEQDGWRLDFQGQEASRGDAWWVALVLRSHLLHTALPRARGIVDVHGAAVARDGEACLLIGTPLSGKTTLAVALVERGWALLSDDMAILTIETGVVEPFRKPVGIRAPGWERVRHRWTPPEWMPPVTDHAQVPAAAFGPPPEGPARPRWFVFVEFSPDTRIEELSSAQAAALALTHGGRADAEAVATVAEAARGSVCRRLRFSDPQDGIVLLGLDSEV